MTAKTQKDFFNTILSSNKNDNKNVEIYQELVYIRFEDVIKSSLPIFTASLESILLEQYIRLFISNGANTSFVWKIPFEFVTFLI